MMFRRGVSLILVLLLTCGDISQLSVIRVDCTTLFWYVMTYALRFPEYRVIPGAAYCLDDGLTLYRAIRPDTQWMEFQTPTIA